MSVQCPQPKRKPRVRRKPEAVRPYCRPNVIGKADERLREVREARALAAELARHVGGRPSVTQAAIIEQIRQVRLRLAVMDRRFAETGTQTDHDARVYLAHANTVARMLARLGLQPPPQAGASLADYLARREAKATPQVGEEPDLPSSSTTAPDTDQRAPVPASGTV
jgi:hypothetical protein